MGGASKEGPEGVVVPVSRKREGKGGVGLGGRSGGMLEGGGEGKWGLKGAEGVRRDVVGD